MFNVFMRGHLLTKKFFTFLIGSTYITHKLKAVNFNKHFSIHSEDFNNDFQNFHIGSPSYVYESKYEKMETISICTKIQNIFSQSNLNFLKQNIFMSFNSMFFLMCTFSNKTMFCEVEKLKKPYLGCSIRSIDEPQGVQIVMIKSDSPAEKAGLKVKDIILEIDGKPVKNINEYNAAIGSEANVKILKIARKEGDNISTLEINVEFIFSE